MNTRLWIIILYSMGYDGRRNTFSSNRRTFDWHVSIIAYQKNVITNRLYTITFDQDIGGINGSWNTSKVINMFYNAESFNQNIGRWNTRIVVNMHMIFDGAVSFN